MSKLHTLFRKPTLAGVIIGLVWFGILAVWFADIAQHYYPFAEEWSLLAHSLPGLADPGEWVFRGFGDYLPAYEHLRQNATNFIRPVYNFGTWLKAVIWGENYSNFVYFNFFTLASCAALCLYAGLRLNLTAGDRRISTWLIMLVAISVPLLPAMASLANLFQAAFVPMMAFDPMIACLAVIACLAHRDGRFLIATIAATLALFTKEQALPLAIALPAIHVWNNRNTLGKALPAIVLLSTPFLVWLLLRLNAYGHLYSGTYVMVGVEHGFLQRVIKGLLTLPWYSATPKVLFTNTWSVESLLAVANVMTLVGSSVFIVSRWSKQQLNALELTVIGSYLFLALVGPTARFGALLQLCLAVMLIQPQVSVSKLNSIARVVAIAGLMITAVGWGWHSYKAYPHHADFWERHYRISQSYATVLQSLPEKAEVVVLNDPSTAFTAAQTLAQSIRRPELSVSKASDFPWRWPTKTSLAPDQSCESSGIRTDSHNVTLTQSCGFSLLGVGAIPEYAASEGIPIGAGHIARIDQNQALPVLHLITRSADTVVIYFDPQDDSFKKL